MTIRSVARLHTFDGEQLTIAQIHARVPVLSSDTVRRYLKAGRHTKADMLSERRKVPCKAWRAVAGSHSSVNKGIRMTATVELDAAEPVAPPKKKSKSGSPTQRTLAAMRKRGFLCAVVEKWNQHARIRQDLFGFIDVLCIGDNEVVGIQACSDGDISTRVKKITDHEHVAAVRKAGIRILVQGWRKKGRFWQMREVDVS